MREGGGRRQNSNIFPFAVHGKITVKVREWETVRSEERRDDAQSRMEGEKDGY